MENNSFANKVPMSKVFWTNELVLKLIELYRQNECLWNTKNIDYKNRSKKSRAWDHIANEIEIPRTLIESKVHNIRTQFMRERKKMHDSMRSNAGGENVYVTNWFAYDNLLFLLDNMDSSIIFTENQDTDPEEGIPMKTESPTEINNEEDGESSGNASTCNLDLINHLRKRKSKRHTDESKSTQSNYKMTPVHGNSWRDDSSIYGEYIASEIRKLKNDRVAAIVKNHINNIIFEAQMGNYDYSYHDHSENNIHSHTIVTSHKGEQNGMPHSTPKLQLPKQDGN